MVNYNNMEGGLSLRHKLRSKHCLPLWNQQNSSQKQVYKNLCLLSVVFAFSVGLLVGIFIPLLCLQKLDAKNASYSQNYQGASSEIRRIFVNHSYGNTYESPDEVDEPRMKLEVTSDESRLKSFGARRKSFEEGPKAFLRSKTFDSQAKTFYSQAKTFDSNSKIYDSSLKSFDSNSKPVDASAKRFDSNGKQFDSNAKRFDSSGKHDDSSTKYVDSNAKYFDSSGKHFDSSIKYFDSNAKRFDSTAKHLDSSSEAFSLHLKGLSRIKPFQSGVGIGVPDEEGPKSEETSLNPEVPSKGLTPNSEILNEFPTVSFIERFQPQATLPEEESLVSEGVFWGSKVEKALPEGYNRKQHETWANYVKKSVGIKLENGCGRMQNRLVTFEDGSQGCVRYRQNTDQIQGELFSFYLAQLLKLPNLAPSTVSVVNLDDPTWKNLANEISSAQWNSNRPVVLTKYITNLDSANIPPIFKPEERHLNRNDMLNMTLEGNLKNLVELAQWSDLIVFDYLTANLDRIVNNLYNYQWNVNIMDAPAHNLAKKLDSNLLVFLDNESGLLHGYRLLKKYEVYHTILLDNLCLFRRQTAEVIKRLRKDGNVGVLLRGMFEDLNGVKVKDVLPTLPDKSVKILNERIDKVYNQIVKCQAVFAERSPT